MLFLLEILHLPVFVSCGNTSVSQLETDSDTLHIVENVGVSLIVDTCSNISNFTSSLG